MYELLCASGAEPDDAAIRWYDAQMEQERAFVDLINRDDVDLKHPKAHELRPYQRVGADTLVRRSRTLLCDDLGLGKTAQSVVAVDISRHNKNILVVCPGSVKRQWRDEIVRWTAYPEVPVTVIEAATREEQQAQAQGGWVIVNYECLRVDFDLEQRRALGRPRWVVTGAPDFYTGRLWDWVILDEAHRLKSRKSQIFRCLCELRTRRLAVLTGTPFGNHPAELWTLLHLLDPKRYSSYWRFFDMYVDYEEDPIFGGRRIVGERNPEVLRRELAHQMIMRKKRDVASQLPPKYYQTLQVPLLPKQAEYYKEMRDDLRVTYESGAELEASSVIAQIVRLRQILSTPYTLGLPDVSSKLDAVEEIVDDTEERVLVFTLFRDTVKAVCRRLEGRGISHVHILGGMSSEDVGAAARALNNGDVRVLVATLGAGGVGLNLVGASTVVFVEKHWNPAVQEQAENRAHRITSTLPVHIIDLMCPRTVDDLVDEAVRTKLAMQQAIFSQPLREAVEALLSMEPEVG